MPPGQADRAFLAGLHVLYVEDDPEIREGTADFLRRRVGRLTLATDGTEGLEAFWRERPHLVVTDIQMPRLDGLGMAEAIKAEAPDIPMVITTAFEQTQYLMRAIAIGVDRYVLKPVQSGSLDSALLHCAHKLRMEEELRRQQRLEHELMEARHHEAMSLLAQGMAHEYSGLLAAILAATDSARRQTQPGSPAHLILGVAQRYAGTAQSLSTRLAALNQMNQQLDEEGPLEPLVKASLEEAEQAPNVAVTARFQAGLPPIRFRRDRLDQALRILMDHALQRLPQGGSLNLEAALRQVDDQAAEHDLPSGSYVCLSLFDSGVALPEERLARLFEPYDPTGNQPVLGLDLAICRSIIVAHQGKITVHSEPGKGNHFEVFLPAAKPQAQ